jgi:hypothetical protein
MKHWHEQWPHKLPTAQAASKTQDTSKALAAPKGIKVP